MNVFRFETVDSTSEVAKRLVRDRTCGAPSLVIARDQSAGRGTRGRSWASPRDAGIYMTVIDFVKPIRWPQMTQCTRAAGVACVEVLRDATGLNIGLKPINDLVIRGAKVGGILVEMLASGEEAAILTGVGINVSRASRRVVDCHLPVVCMEDVLEPALFKKINWEKIAMALAMRICEWNSIVATSEAHSLEFAWQSFARDWNLPLEDAAVHANC